MRLKSGSNQPRFLVGARRFLLSFTPVSLIPPQVGATGALLFGSLGSPTSPELDPPSVDELDRLATRHLPSK